MKNTLLKNWWLLTVKGVLLFLLGTVAFFLPEATILVLTTWFGAIIFLGGILSLLALVFFRKKINNGWGGALLLEGILDISFGLIILFFPKITILVFAILIAIWLFFVGLFQIYNAFLVRQAIKSWWMFLLNGLVTAGLGILIWFNPFEGTIALTYLIGTAAIFFGSMLMVTSHVLRRWSSFSKKNNNVIT